MKFFICANEQNKNFEVRVASDYRSSLYDAYGSLAAMGSTLGDHKKWLDAEGDIGCIEIFFDQVPVRLVLKMNKGRLPVVVERRRQLSAGEQEVFLREFDEACAFRRSSGIIEG